MLDLEKTIEVNGEEVVITPETGELNGGNLRVDAVKIEMNGRTAPLRFNGYESWVEVEAAVAGYSVQKLIEIEESNIDTSDTDYTEPKVLREDTEKAKLLKALYHLAPCTNSQIRDDGQFKNVSSKTSSLKDDGLVACVGWQDGSQVLVPTALGVKEIYTMWSIPPTGNATQDYLSSENRTEEDDE